MRGHVVQGHMRSFSIFSENTGRFEAGEWHCWIYVFKRSFWKLYEDWIAERQGRELGGSRQVLKLPGQ